MSGKRARTPRHAATQAQAALRQHCNPAGDDQEDDELTIATDDHTAAPLPVSGACVRQRGAAAAHGAGADRSRVVLGSDAGRGTRRTLARATAAAAAAAADSPLPLAPELQPLPQEVFEKFSRCLLLHNWASVVAKKNVTLARSVQSELLAALQSHLTATPASDPATPALTVALAQIEAAAPLAFAMLVAHHVHEDARTEDSGMRSDVASSMASLSDAGAGAAPAAASLLVGPAIHIVVWQSFMQVSFLQY